MDGLASAGSAGLDSVARDRDDFDEGVAVRRLASGDHCRRGKLVRYCPGLFWQTPPLSRQYRDPRMDVVCNMKPHAQGTALVADEHLLLIL